VTYEIMWEPHRHFGLPLRVGEWMYVGRIPLAVRVFKSDTLYGSSDYEDDPEIGDDKAVECYYLELQVAGEDRWGVHMAFLTLDEIERYGKDSLGGTLKWIEK
jgi:hypothetical protein